MIYLTLFYEFFKTGLFSIGGGLATIPFLKEIGENYGWYSANELTDMIAVAESTPGPVGINMATYAGYKAAGVPGSIVATLSLVLPSVIVICIVAKFLQKFKDNFYVQSAFHSLRASTIGLTGGVMFGIIIIALFYNGAISLATLNIPSLILFAAVIAIVAIFKKLNPIFVIIIGAASGIIFQL